MRLRFAAGLLVVALFPGLLAAQPALTPGDPADVGMSGAVLREGVSLFERAVEQGDLQGAVLLVARRGKIVLVEPVGWRDRDKPLPMARDTLFHVASNTKPVVA